MGRYASRQDCAISATAIFRPVVRLRRSTHSCRVWARPPDTVPMVLAGMPRESGMLLSAELGV